MLVYVRTWRQRATLARQILLAAVESTGRRSSDPQRTLTNVDEQRQARDAREQAGQGQSTSERWPAVVGLQVGRRSGRQVMVVRHYVLPRRSRQSRVPRTNDGGRTRSAMTRAPWVPANRAIPSLYICIWRWRSPGSLLSFGGFQRGSGECWVRASREFGTAARGDRRRPRAASAPSAKSAQFRHRLLGRACIAQAHGPQDGRCRVRVLLWWWWWRPAPCRSIRPPSNTGHGGYRYCRASRVLR